MIEQARRVVKLSTWAWTSGMRDTSGNTYLGPVAPLTGQGRSRWVEGEEIVIVSEVDASSRLPDLTHAGTLGCLRRIVKEAHNAFDIHIRVAIAPRMEGPRAHWRTVDRNGRLLNSGSFGVPEGGDEIICGLVAALETAEW